MADEKEQQIIDAVAAHFMEINLRGGSFTGAEVAAEFARRRREAQQDSLFCSDCPDHEGCATGVPCSLVKKAHPTPLAICTCAAPQGWNGSIWPCPVHAFSPGEIR